MKTEKGARVEFEGFGITKTGRQGFSTDNNEKEWQT